MSQATEKRISRLESRAQVDRAKLVVVCRDPAHRPKLGPDCAGIITGLPCPKCEAPLLDADEGEPTE
jgi:hypothetical protein